MASIISACQAGTIEADPVMVVSPKEGTPAVLRAEAHHVPVEVCSPKSENYGEELAEILQKHKIDLICLAGYLSLLPLNVVRSFENRILNIHPALLPKFGGKGMYGMHVHEAVIAAGEKESGCTVHFVTENYDEGPVILQKKCAVESGDSAEDLALRVLELEHAAYCEALIKVISELK